MKAIALSTAYLAPTEYYIQLASSKHILLEKQEHYVKQSYRNRCVIASANGLQTLSIPIVKTSGKCLIKDIQIADHDRWQHLHWHAIVSAYRSTPFFQYYKDDFCSFYATKQVYLYDFNEKLRELICNLLNIYPEIIYTKRYIKNIEPNHLDLREKIHPKKAPLTQIFKPYFQRFENIYGFQPNLSIIDLLFNMGTEATECLIQ